jgi:hypothetical protein
VLFPVVGTGGSVDFDFSNSPHFGAIATLITNGLTDRTILGFAITDGGPRTAEAALTDPARGVTRARDSLAATKH